MPIRPFKGLIHGDTGVGKSTLARTLSEVCRTLYLCYDTSALYIYDDLKDKHIVKEITSFDQMKKTRNWLLSEGKDEVGGVVVDSVTQGFQRRRTEFTNSDLEHIAKVQMQQWGHIKEEWRLLIDALVRLPNMHTVFLTVSQRVTDELDPGTEARPNYIIIPSIETGLRNEIGCYLMDMGYCYKRWDGQKTRYYITFERGGIDTKLTGPNKISAMENPTFERILAEMNKG